jgi:hypothetical protein
MRSRKGGDHGGIDERRLELLLEDLLPQLGRVGHPFHEAD